MNQIAPMSRAEINRLPLSGDAFRFLEIVNRRMRHKQRGATVWHWRYFFCDVAASDGYTYAIARELEAAGMIALIDLRAVSLTDKGVSYARACAC